MKRIYRLLIAILLIISSVIMSSCDTDPKLAAGMAALPAADASLNVHFIDVGQGDCTLIQLPEGKTVLIDGGNRADTSTILSYLNDLGIKKIDFLIATHPHEDHIGSLPEVVKSFKIGSIYMPQATANTKIFEDLLKAIESKGYKINKAIAGKMILEENDIKISILAPNSSDYEELNNYSAVVKLCYKDVSFLFTGDAEDVSEKEMLSKRLDLSADVIKIGHHGGRTSSTGDFLEAVAPRYAIIQCGKDNDYGHPHPETLRRLAVLDIQILRNDQLGSIIASTDGSKIAFNKEPKDLTLGKQELSSYIGNKKSMIFHQADCTSLPIKQNQIVLQSRTAAIQEGYEPCQRCKP